MRPRTIRAGLLAAVLIAATLPTVAQAQENGDRTETELEATAAIGRVNAAEQAFYAPAFQAQLTTVDGEAVEGQTLRFEVDGNHACSAETGASGYGYCFAPAATALTLADGGYDAVFAGTAELQGSTDHAPLAVVFGQTVGG